MLLVSEKEFLTHFAQGSVLVDVFKPDCLPCAVAANLLSEIEKEYPHVRFLAINAEEAPWFVKEFDIQYAPTLLLFREGELVDKVVRAVRRPILVRKIEGSL